MVRSDMNNMMCFKSKEKDDLINHGKYNDYKRHLKYILMIDNQSTTMQT